MADYQSKYTGEQIDEAIGKALEGGGSGGGQPLYRHQVAIMADGDNDADAFQFAFYSTSGEQIEDMEQLYQAIRLTGDENLNYPVVSGTHYYADTSKYIPFAYVTFYRIFDTQLKDATFYLHLTNGETAVSNNPYVEDDIVTEIGTASVSGGGGSCVITDLGEQAGHGVNEAQATIIDRLKPDSVPVGNYLFTYWTNCMSNSAIVICYKEEACLNCMQITSEGKYRKFRYTFEKEEEWHECFQPLGGNPLYRHDIYIRAGDEFEVAIPHISTSDQPISTEAQLKEVLGQRTHVSCSGTISTSEGGKHVSYISYISTKDYYLLMHADIVAGNHNINLFSEDYHLDIYDTVTPL